MIQIGTYLNVADNSGGKKIFCIKVLSSSQCRYAAVGDLILVSVKTLRAKRRSFSKVKKGEIYKALVIRTKFPVYSFFGDKTQFTENAAVLLNKQQKIIGTRIFGSVLRSFRFTKFLKILSVSSNICC